VRNIRPLVVIAVTLGAGMLGAFVGETPEERTLLGVLAALVVGIVFARLLKVPMLPRRRCGPRELAPSLRQEHPLMNVWSATILALGMILAATIHSGGIYQTVSVGESTVFRANRFTGAVHLCMLNKCFPTTWWGSGEAAARGGGMPPRPLPFPGGKTANELLGLEPE
jgi:hypothetical protein